MNGGGPAEVKILSGEVSVAGQDPAHSYPVDGRFYKADARTFERQKDRLQKGVPKGDHQRSGSEVKRSF
jgi:hypothetical protein